MQRIDEVQKMIDKTIYFMYLCSEMLKDLKLTPNKHIASKDDEVLFFFICIYYTYMYIYKVYNFFKLSFTDFNKLEISADVVALQSY